jgi:GDP-4-dehydro-6-deoxy-D-mannose reductase
VTGATRTDKANAPCLVLTGGTGFVGGFLAPRLREVFAGYRTVILGRGGEKIPQGWELTEVDLADETAINAAIAQLKPDILVHLAAQSSVAQAATAAEMTWRVNFCATFALALAVRKYAPDCLFFFTSTGEVYGSGFLAGLAREETPPSPTNAYAISKLAAERMLQDVLPAQTRLVITRALNHSGPGQDERFVLPSFAAQIARAEAGLAEPRIQVGNLSAERDFLHVEDVVEAYIGLLTLGRGLPPRTIVNVCSGRPTRLTDLLDMLLARATIPIEVTVDPARLRPSDIPVAAGDNARLKALTGWQPARPLDQLIDDLLAAQRQKIYPAAAKP